MISLPKVTTEYGSQEITADMIVVIASEVCSNGI